MKDNNLKKVALTVAGAVAAGAAMKLMKKSDGTMNPIASLAALGGGTYLIIKGKGDMKALGHGLTAMGAMGTISVAASKIEPLKKFTPTLGDLYEDEDGNIIEMDGLAGAPQLVQDENGQTYMVEGLAGDELDDEMYDDPELLGIEPDMAELV